MEDFELKDLVSELKKIVEELKEEELVLVNDKMSMFYTRLSGYYDQMLRIQSRTLDHFDSNIMVFSEFSIQFNCLLGQRSANDNFYSAMVKTMTLIQFFEIDSIPAAKSQIAQTFVKLELNLKAIAQKIEEIVRGIEGMIA